MDQALPKGKKKERGSCPDLPLISPLYFSSLGKKREKKRRRLLRKEGKKKRGEKKVRLISFISNLPTLARYPACGGLERKRKKGGKMKREKRKEAKKKRGGENQLFLRPLRLLCWC